MQQWWEHTAFSGPTYMRRRASVVKIDSLLPAVEDMVVMVRDLNTVTQQCAGKRIAIPYYVGENTTQADEETIRRLIARTLLYEAFREWPVYSYDPTGMDVGVIAGINRGRLVFGEEGYPREIEARLFCPNQLERELTYEAKCNNIHLVRGCGWALWGAGAFQLGAWADHLVRPDWLLIQLGFNPNLHRAVR